MDFDLLSFLLVAIYRPVLRRGGKAADFMLLVSSPRIVERGPHVSGIVPCSDVFIHSSFECSAVSLLFAVKRLVSVTISLQGYDHWRLTSLHYRDLGIVLLC